MVMDGFSDVYGSWNTTWISWLSSLRCARVALEISWPRYRMLPPVTGARPSTARPRVVLPEPDSPTRPTVSPGGCPGTPP